MLTIGPDAHGTMVILSSVPLPSQIRSPFAITSDANAGFLILGLKEDAGCLHRVNDKGELLASYVLPTPPPYSPSTALNGTVTSNPISKRVVYVPENPYVFAEVDPLHGIVRATPRNDPSFRAPNGITGTLAARGDRVLRAVYLPDGDLLVQIVKRGITWNSNEQADVLRTSSYLELFDSAMSLKATGISVAGFGQLQGASQDGGIFFSLISPQDGIQVVKARLRVE
jgi:hypothetical protein